MTIILALKFDAMISADQNRRTKTTKYLDIKENQETTSYRKQRVEDLAIRTISQPKMEGVKSVGRYVIYALRYDLLPHDHSG